MKTDAAAVNFLGLDLYTYGLYLSIGFAFAAGFIFYQGRKIESYKNAAALTCLISSLMSLVMARLVFVLFEVNFWPFLSIENAVNLKIGGLSMYGAIVGAVFGAVLAARISKINFLFWLDLTVPALFLLITFARLGEAYTTLGISRPLVTDTIKHTFLAFHDEYDAYLRTYLLESFTALMLCIATLFYRKRYQKPGHTIMFAALLFGISQTLFESLRFDAHLRFSFIGLQQVLSIVLFSSVIIWLALHQLKKKNNRFLSYMTLALLPLSLAALLGLEFMIDRSGWSKWLLYVIYIFVLTIPAISGLRLLKKDCD